MSQPSDYKFYSIAECVEILNGIDDIHIYKYLEVVKVLKDEPAWREELYMFVKPKEEARSSSSDPSDKCSVSKCIKELNDMKDLHIYKYVAAANALKDDPE
ncbi:hypothetical protein ACFE04_007281 [Oxalis oulophora]